MKTHKSKSSFFTYSGWVFGHFVPGLVIGAIIAFFNVKVGLLVGEIAVFLYLVMGAVTFWKLLSYGNTRDIEIIGGMTYTRIEEFGYGITLGIAEPNVFLAVITM